MRFRRELRNLRVTVSVTAVAVAILWSPPALGVDCPEVLIDSLALGDSYVQLSWTMNEYEDQLEDFGGYRVWMKELWKGDEWSLVREYLYCCPRTVCQCPGSQECCPQLNPAASNFWIWEDSPFELIRTDGAPIFQNAFPYEFSVTAFSAADPEVVQEDCRDANSTGPVHPRAGVRSDLRGVRCIPNPYRASADWEYESMYHRREGVTFVGLPQVATIRIYTTAATHVRTLVHDDPESDLEFWDLRNEDGAKVAAGVYIFSVEGRNITGRDPETGRRITEGIGTTEGRVMIIK